MRPGKPRQSAALPDYAGRGGTAEIKFQDRCLKPLGHPSTTWPEWRTYTICRQTRVKGLFGEIAPATPITSTGDDAFLNRFAALVTGSAAGQANDEIGGPCRPAQKQTGLSICRYREVPEGADPGQSMIGTVLMLFFGLPSMTRSL